MSNNETMPSAYITVCKGRKKVIDNTVYLNNGQEFELELFNPTTDNLLVKIWINNKQMSSSGVVLRPGDRVFLERYIDIPKKFLFDTYEVNGNNESVQKAIEKNGLVKVQFFREDVSVGSTHLYTNELYFDFNYPFSDFLGVPNGNPILSNTTTTLGDNTTTYSRSSVHNIMNLTSTVGTIVQPTTVPTGSNNLRSKKSLETGRVEQGSNSDQTFTKVNKKFYMYPMNTIEYQIKPTSTQPINVRSLPKSYCTGCGKKTKPSNKFCSNCGTKL